MMLRLDLLARNAVLLTVFRGTPDDVSPAPGAHVESLQSAETEKSAISARIGGVRHLGDNLVFTSRAEIQSTVCPARQSSTGSVRAPLRTILDMTPSAAARTVI